MVKIGRSLLEESIYSLKKSFLNRDDSLALIQERLKSTEFNDVMLSHLNNGYVCKTENKEKGQIYIWETENKYQNRYKIMFDDVFYNYIDIDDMIKFKALYKEGCSSLSYLLSLVVTLLHADKK